MTDIESYILEHHKEMCVSEIAKALDETPQRIYYAVLKMGLIGDIKNNSNNNRTRKASSKKEGYFNVDEVGPGGNWIV